MIKVENIHKSYADLEVLKGVSVTIAKGELVSLVGASGAGKTTLLHIMGTLDTPSEGRVFIDNTDIASLSANKLSQFRNQNIGFIFQFHQLLPEFTALENVCMPGLIGKKSKTKVEKRAKELLDYLRLKDRISHKPAELSGGEQQRIAVARALINDPLIIYADEPSGNLDSTNAKELHELFFDLRKEFGQTFVIVTHNEELAEMADRKLVMIDGKISNGTQSNQKNTKK